MNPPPPRVLRDPFNGKKKERKKKKKSMQRRRAGDADVPIQSAAAAALGAAVAK